jgi:hypothetical protein
VFVIYSSTKLHAGRTPAHYIEKSETVALPLVICVPGANVRY